MASSWGEAVRETMAKAKKAGVDLSPLKPFDKFLAGLDEAYQLFSLISPALPVVQKFMLNPDPAATRDIKIFLEKKAQYVALCEKLFPISAKFSAAVEQVQKPLEKAKDRKKADAVGEIAQRSNSFLPLYDPKRNHPLFGDVKADALKKELQKRADEVRQRQEKLRQQQEEAAKKAKELAMLEELKAYVM